MLIGRLLLIIWILLLTGCVSGSRGMAGSPGVTTDEARTAAWFEAHRHQPTRLRSFLQRMPKGGDIHAHLSGSVYAESYLAWAAADDFCLDEVGAQPRIEKCPEDSPETGSLASPRRVAEAVKDPRIYNRLIDQMSTRDRWTVGRSGHDDFFATFSEFFPIARGRHASMLAEVAARAASEHTRYLELMVTVRGGEARVLGRDVRLDTADLASTRDRLLAAGLLDIVAGARQDLDRAEAKARRLLECDNGEPAPGCGVEIRYLQQAIRVRPPSEVFAQLVLAFELARADPRVVGINLVGPEDDRVARGDYRRHMEMLDFLGSRAPEVNVSLHAGELAFGMVPPEDLRFHIRQAIELGHARRLGHATALAFEDDPIGLLGRMRERGIAVEVCLTSNDVILGIRDDEHPFRTYMAAGIPLVLATDDAGVSRIDLSHEFMRAAHSYDLGYLELKTFARHSLAHSFLPGDSLWREYAAPPREGERIVAAAGRASGVPPQAGQRPTVVAVCAGQPLGSPSPSAACIDFLESSERAWQQWRLEAELAAFEALRWDP